MMFYSNIFFEETGRKITLGEFKEIFKDWNGDLDFLTSEEFEKEFDSLHCAKDPFEDEIKFLDLPLVERTFDDLYDEWSERNWAI